MSLTVEPDYQDFIVRIADVLRRSPRLFPHSVGGSNSEKDLITQVIENQLPIPQMSVEGPDPPYIFVAQSENAIVSQEQRGRNTRSIRGGRRMTLEFYIVVLSSATRSKQESNSQLFDIISAATTELGNNLELVNSSGLDPLAITHTYNVVPYIFDITQNETAAKNITLRVVTGVNLR